MLQSAIEQTALELGKAMPVMSRGPELELSTIKDVEDLKHTLAKAMVHIPTDVLRRAIILPKDMDTSNGKYATPGDLLPKGINDSIEGYQRRQQEKLLSKVYKWRDRTFADYYVRNEEKDDEG